MLQKLYIRNYAIIDELTIVFDPHLNVITGETGAGKSIILGALSLILGDRADTSVLINRDEKCIIEATFQTAGNTIIQDLLAQEELDPDTSTIIRREITNSGKSRAFINDTPVKLNILNKITANLVDLHRQFDNYILRDWQFTFEVVDAIAENQLLLGQYQRAFKAFKSLQKEIELAISNQLQWQKEADYKQFLFDELAEADLKDGALEAAEQSFKQLSHAEQIKSILQSVYYTLEEEETAVNLTLKRSQQQLSTISAIHPPAAALEKRLNSVLLELRDLAMEASSLESQVELNAGDLELLQEKIDKSYRLLKKHQVQTTAELIGLYNNLKADLENHSNAEEQIRQLQDALQKQEQEISDLAKQLHAQRIKKVPGFVSDVNKLLKLVGMPNAVFKIEISNKAQFDEYGKDEIAFLWDANKSGVFQSFQKTASGGELSRVMLCIKSLTAKALALPTLIFDEVDTGISGEAARQVGLLMRKLSNSHQVLSITHQPQIAAKGTTHFYVYKTAAGDQKINTHVRKLEEKERVQVVAQMIGGDNPSSAALKNAKELMETMDHG